MALLDLGDISFGLGAETAKLKAAVSELRKFGSVINRTARSQQTGAQKAVSQLNKQEKAIRSALQALLSMNAEIRRTGADPSLLGQNTRAFQKLSRTLTSGEVDLVSFTRAQDRFRASLNNTGRTLRKFKADEARKSVGRFNEVMRDLESASVLAVGPLSGVGARIRALGAITSRSTLKIAGLFAGITGLIVGLAKLTAGAIRSRKEIEKIEKALVVATGSVVGARREFEFISKTAVEFGVDIIAAGEQFAKLSAAARDTVLEGKAVRELFKGTAAAASALGLSIEEVSGIFRALQQIVSKGTVQAEELRGQFGERLVGGFKLAADAMGVTTQELGKMVEAGEVGIELLVKLGDTLRDRFAKEGREAAKGFQGSINNLNNAILLFNKSLDGSLKASQIFIGAIQSLTSVINALAPFVDILVGSFIALGAALIGAILPEIIKGFIFLAGAIRSAGAAMLAFNVAILANPLTAFSAVMGRVILALAAGTIAFFAFIRAGESVVETNLKLIRSAGDFIIAAKAMGGASKELTNQIIEDTKKQIRITEIRIESLQAAANALRDSLEIDIPFPIGDLGANVNDDKIKELRETLSGLVKELEELTNVGEKPAIGLDKLSAVAQNLDKSMDDLILNFRALRREEDALASGGGLQVIQTAKDLNEVLKVLGDTTDLTRQDIRLLTESLVEAGIGSIALLKGFGELTDDQALQVLIGQVLELVRSNRQLEETNEATIKSLEDYTKVVKDVEDSISDLRAELLALESGAPNAIKDLKREFADRDELLKFIKALDEVNASSADIEELAGTFSKLQAEILAAEEEMEKLAPAISAIEGAFGTLKTTIIDTFTGGKTAMEALRDVALDVIKRVLDALLEITLIRPAIENTVSAFNNLGDSSGSSGGKGLFGQLLGGIGDFFGGGGAGASTSGFSGGGSTGFAFAAHGGRLTPGRPTIVGEQGPELIIPGAGAGTVIPNDKLESGGGQFIFSQTINISPGVAEAVRREIHILRPTLQRDAINAVGSARRLGIRI